MANLDGTLLDRVMFLFTDKTLTAGALESDVVKLASDALGIHHAPISIGFTAPIPLASAGALSVKIALQSSKDGTTFKDTGMSTVDIPMAEFNEGVGYIAFPRRFESVDSLYVRVVATVTGTPTAGTLSAWVAGEYQDYKQSRVFIPVMYK